MNWSREYQFRARRISLCPPSPGFSGGSGSTNEAVPSRAHRGPVIGRARRIRFSIARIQLGGDNGLTTDPLTKAGYGGG